MRWFVVVMLTCSAWGQKIIEPPLKGEIAAYFHPLADEKHLACEVSPMRPRLDFVFRVQAGYITRIPMKQFFGPGHMLVMATKITPEGREPVYLINGMKLPNIRKNKLQWDFGGSYALGDGRYQVEWLVGDDQSRFCRKNWTVDVKLAAADRSSKALPPLTVGEVSLRRLSSLDTESDRRRIPRVTVLLHAAPVIPRMTRLRAQDRGFLISSLVGLTENLPAKSVRLVVFNLDQQRELFRQDALAPDAYDPLMQSMTNLQLQLVDYKVLQNRGGHISLLADLINQELNSKEPSDAVIFLGPTSRYYDRFPELGVTQGPGPRFFYIQYKPEWDRGQDFPDCIDHAVKNLKGKTMRIHSPDEFAKAIRQIDAQMTQVAAQ